SAAAPRSRGQRAGRGRRRAPLYLPPVPARPRRRRDRRGRRSGPGPGPALGAPARRPADAAQRPAGPRRLLPPGATVAFPAVSAIPTNNRKKLTANAGGFFVPFRVFRG